MLVVPADGVKGKTWGPSTLHQRERGQIITRVVDGVPGGPKRWSRSAPNLEKHAAAARGVGTPNIAALQEIGMNDQDLPGKGGVNN